MTFAVPYRPSGMGTVKVDISMSLDGFIAGPNPSHEQPLGERGELLHEWGVSTEAFQKAHGREGGEAGPDSDVIGAMFENVGAAIMGRRMFSGGPGRWGDGPFEGWWGAEPPFHCPVFVLTTHEREPLVKG